MKKLITVLILIALGGGGAWYYYTYGKVQEKPTIQQLTISQGDITETVSATGTLEALRTVAVGSQVSGVVQDIFADFNYIVKAGQVLAKIDPALLQVQVDLQNANVERQKGEIENQKVQLEQAKTDLKRTQELFDKGLANQQQLDQSQLTVKTRTTSLDAAQKQLLTNEANLSQAKLNVDYTTIKAPIDGVIVNRAVDKGQTVQQSMQVATFFTLATDLRSLKLTAGVDEAEIGKIKPDMDVTFTVDSYQGQTFHGKVNSVRLNAQTTNNVVTYPVWIDAPNPDLKLRPSMTAQIKIIISTAPGAIRIPNQALRFRPNADIYTALGLTPPAAGQGRGVNAAGGDANGGAAGGRRRGGDQNGGATPGAPGATTPAAGAPAAGAPQQSAANRGGGAAVGPEAQAGGGQNRQRGQGGQGGQDQGGGQGQPGGQGQGGRGGRGQGGAGGQGQGGRGFGQGMQNLSPEERQRMMDQFARGGGGNRQGRGFGQQQPSNIGVAPKPLEADKIDQLFAGVPKRILPGTVWLWDEATKKLTEVRVQTGISDGQFVEMVSGELKVGQQVVSQVVLPVKATSGSNSIFGQQPGRGGQGGLQPGGPGGFGGGPGGGGPGGGGGGRGGGGGGGRGGI